jgi:hypothetical protein
MCAIYNFNFNLYIDKLPRASPWDFLIFDDLFCDTPRGRLDCDNESPQRVSWGDDCDIFLFVRRAGKRTPAQSSRSAHWRGGRLSPAHYILNIGARPSRLFCIDPRGYCPLGYGFEK